MAKLATCPGCTTQLALPEDATLSDRARCPRCHEEFLLMETVQFSIPTAEILPPPELEVTTPTDTFSPAAYTPDPYIPPGNRYEQPVPTYDAPIDADESLAEESEPIPRPFPVSATLSDWEARLKRAISADVEDEPPSPPTTKPSFAFANLTPTDPTLAEPVTYEPQDFEVPDDDLVPESHEPPRSLDDWAAEDSYRENEEPTVKFAADQTVADVALPDYPQLGEGLPQMATPVAVRTDVASRKKRKRSPLRTLASASLGVVGIPLGLYALLWLRGPAGDMLHIAQYLPSFMLPAEFSQLDGGSATEQIARQPFTTDETEPEEALAANEPEPEPIADADPLVREDAAVSPASAELPAYQGPTFALVDAAEFSELLTAAQQFAPQLSQDDLKSKESVASKGQAYMALARLADKSAFLNQPGHTPDDAAKAEHAQVLLQTALREQTVLRDLPQIALRWWQYAQRPSPGIVLIGEVKRLQSTDAGTIAFVSLGTDTVAPEIPVLVGKAEHREGDYVGVAGSIEPNLQQRLPALGVSIGPAVIAHYSFPIDDTSHK